MNAAQLWTVHYLYKGEHGLAERAVVKVEAVSSVHANNRAVHAAHEEGRDVVRLLGAFPMDSIVSPDAYTDLFSN